MSLAPFDKLRTFRGRRDTDVQEKIKQEWPAREIFLAFVGGEGIVYRVVVVLGIEECGPYGNEHAT
jgi:hypothetical protein